MPALTLTGKTAHAIVVSIWVWVAKIAYENRLRAFGHCGLGLHHRKKGWCDQRRPNCYPRRGSNL